VDSLQGITGWLEQNGQRAFLGEFGAGPDQTCLGALDGMLTFVDDHPTQWVGWAYWAAGPWWRTSNTMIVTDSQTPAQLTTLVQHL
jgi:endoglucanase